MTSETGRRPEPRLGRKQDPSRSDAILAATRELILDPGYDRFTVQDVADRAGAGIGAIYRRWPNKESLVAEAIRSGGDLSYTVSDDPRADLINLIRDRVALATNNPDFVSGAVAAMRSSAEIREAMDQIYSIDPYREILGRLLGADHPHSEALSELAPAIIVHRSTFGGHLDAETLSNDILGLVDELVTATAR